VVEKFPQVAGTGELPSNTNDVNSVKERPCSPARSRQKKGGIFCRPCSAIGGANGAARVNCIAEGERAAKMHAWAQFRIARPDRKSSKFSQMTHCASSKDRIA
jgi:hypothetical protein